LLLAAQFADQRNGIAVGRCSYTGQVQAGAPDGRQRIMASASLTVLVLNSHYELEIPIGAQVVRVLFAVNK
jgi:hypothetical protein